MSQLPTAIASFGTYRQFQLWTLIQLPDQSKPSKVPVNATGYKIDAHDPANHMSFDEAAALSAATGYNVAFVLTDNDPFWFLDIDNCRNADGTWAQVAEYAFQWFAGAAVEVSQSGNGLHFFGCGQVPPGYKKRNQHLGLEFYTTKRLVSLTMGEMQGDAWTDHTVALSQYIPAHFAPSTGTDVAAEWTTEPRPEWNGPEDDDELIEKMIHNRGAAATFGTKASFKDLWEANGDVLARFFPDPEQGRAYDASAADSALFSHLAFWTGCNCERMNRIARRSALVRDKWDRHPSYISRTAIGAVSRCVDVYSSGKSQSLTEVGGAVGGSSIMTIPEQYEYFDSHVYIASLNQVYVGKTGRYYKPESYNNKFGGKAFVYTWDNNTTKKPLEALTLNQCRTYDEGDVIVKTDDVWFRPDLPQHEITEHGGALYVNSYRKPKIEVTHGDVSKFFHWFEKVLPVARDREILLCYMAAIAQNPGVKFQWCPVIQGTYGNGKSMLSSIIRYCVGGSDPALYCHNVQASNLDSGGLKFNKWIEGNIFIEIEEIHTRDKHNLVEALKPYITNSNIEVQGKGADQRSGYNCANFMMFSNHLDAVMKTKDDRRYAIFYMAQQSRADLIRDGLDPNTGYMPDLYAWLRSGGYADMAGYLLQYEINPAYNPAGGCHVAPETSSTQQAIEESRSPLEQDILEQIAQGRRGFANGWISSIKLNEYLEESNMARRIGHTLRRDILKSLGYHPHPHLPSGRLTTALVDEGGGRPVLYVHESLTEVGTEPRWVYQMYLQSQGYIDPVLAPQVSH